MNKKTSVQSPCRTRAMQMYLSKLGNWPSISENTDAMLENLFEGTIYTESSQIKW